MVRYDTALCIEGTLRQKGFVGEDLFFPLLMIILIVMRVAVSSACSFQS